MGLLDRIFKDIFEDKAGKIHISSGGWLFNPSESLVNKTLCRNANFYRGKPYVRKDADGNDMTLVHQRSVICPNPEMGQGIYPRHESEPNKPKKYSVPYVVCRKCQYHEKTEHRGRYRFPRCMFRAADKPAEEAIKGTMGLLSDATTEANKIMGRTHA